MQQRRLLQKPRRRGPHQRQLAAAAQSRRVSASRHPQEQPWLRAPELEGRCAPLRLGGRVVRRGRLLRRRRAGGAPAWRAATQRQERAHRRAAPPLTRARAPRVWPPRAVVRRTEATRLARPSSFAPVHLRPSCFPPALWALPPWTRRRSGAWACCAATWMRPPALAARWLSRPPPPRAWARPGPRRAATAWRFRSACPATSTSTGAHARLPRHTAQLPRSSTLG